MVEEKPKRGPLTLGEDASIEYAACWESWRFFLAFRSTLLLFSFTVTSALLFFFFKEINGSSLGDKPRFIICILGTVFTYAIIAIEGRNRQMYSACLGRAIAIESSQITENNTQKTENAYGLWKYLWLNSKAFLGGSKLELPEPAEHNLADLLFKTPVHFLSWQTGGIYLFYGTMFVTWLGFLIYISFIKHFMLTITVVVIILVLLGIGRLVLRRRKALL